MSAKIKSPWAVDAAVVVDVVCNSQTYALSFSLLPLPLSSTPFGLAYCCGVGFFLQAPVRWPGKNNAYPLRILCRPNSSPCFLPFSLSLFLLLPLPLRLAPAQPLNLFICLPRCSVVVVVVVAFTFKQFHLQAATNFSFYYFRCQLLFGAPRQFFSYLSFLLPLFLAGHHCREQ